MNTTKVLLGVLVGVAAGALVGILFAPDKGVETRRKIAKKGMDYADDLNSKMNIFLENVTEKFESFVKKEKEKAENLTGNSAV